MSNKYDKYEKAKAKAERIDIIDCIELQCYNFYDCYSTQIFYS